MIQRAFRPLSKKILKKDPSFLEKVRNGIKQEGIANGIDPEKFCFDIDKRDKLFNEYKTDEILKIIDPDFLNKKIKFGGFVKGSDEIEYERYIRAVVRELPKDKNIIMKDGRELTPKQFIENEIPKLEQKYNINIKKLLEENIIIKKEEVNKNRNIDKQKVINNIKNMESNTRSDNNINSKKDNRKINNITNNAKPVNNNINNSDFKENTNEERDEKKKVSNVNLSTEKTNLPMKIGFFEKIKQSFKKIKEIVTFQIIGKT